MMQLGPIYACRICLTGNIKLFHLNTFQHRSYYEEILNSTLPGTDNLLKYICYQCSALLEKYHLFRKRCLKSQDVLKNIMSKKWKVPIEHVLKLEQIKHKIQPSLSIMVPTDRLGVYEFKEVVKNNVRPATDMKINEPIPVQDCEIVEDGEFDTIVIEVEDTSQTVQHEIKMKEPVVQHEIKMKEPVVQHEIKMKKPVSPVKECTKQKTYVNPRVYTRAEHARQKECGYELDPKKWKIVTLTIEEASREYFAKVEQRKKKYRRTRGQFVCYCTKCDKGFTSENILKRHMFVHSEGRGPCECALCKRRFKWPTHLRAHMEVHQMRYHCLRCSLVFPTSFQSKIHEKIHDGVKYTCKYCDARFLNPSSYYTHLRLMHRSAHLCSMCGASFVSQAGLRQHIAMIHAVEGAEHVTSNGADGETNVYCDKCDITFETLRAYEQHKSNSAMHVDDTNHDAIGQEAKSKLLKPGKRLCKLTPTICEQCGLEFPSKHACSRHRRIVHMPSPEPSAPVVPKRSAKKERYICDVCGASLAPSSVQQHRNSHTRAKVYPCPTCGKVFNTPTNRNRHMVVHTGEKRYACRLCNKRFTQPDNVKLHIRTYHMKLPAPYKHRKRSLPKFADLRV